MNNLFSIIKKDFRAFTIIVIGIILVITVGLIRNNYHLLTTVREQQIVNMEVSKTIILESKVESESQKLETLSKIKDLPATTAGDSSFSNKELIDMLFVLCQAIVGLFSVLLAYLTRTNGKIVEKKDEY